LTRPIIIPDVIELRTLADVQILVEKHLPKEYRSKFTWRQNCRTPQESYSEPSRLLMSNKSPGQWEPGLGSVKLKF
jgi:hypothetical protein